MDKARHRARFDWLAELGGASALALAVAYAGFKAAPSLALTGEATMLACGFGSFAGGLLVMRAVTPIPKSHRLPEFAIAFAAGEELLADDVAEEPLLLDQLAAEDTLLLEDVLLRPAANDRVVALFAASMPPPVELKQKTDRQPALDSPAAISPMPRSATDASAALFAALDDLKRSLR